MENKTTQQLHEELVSREGVTEIVIGPYEKIQIVQDQRTHEFTGQVRVLVNKNCDLEVSITDIKNLQNNLTSYFDSLSDS